MNWKELLNDLSERGLTQPEIAERCGVTQSAISQLFTGRTLEPSYPLGNALRQLHARTRRKLKKG